MEVEYSNVRGETLCFTHAVKAVIEDDETVTASVPDLALPQEDAGGSGYLGQTCRKCFPLEEWEEEYEDGDD